MCVKTVATGSFGARRRDTKSDTALDESDVDDGGVGRGGRERALNLGDSVCHARHQETWVARGVKVTLEDKWVHVSEVSLKFPDCIHGLLLVRVNRELD